MTAVPQALDTLAGLRAELFQQTDVGALNVLAAASHVKAFVPDPDLANYLDRTAESAALLAWMVKRLAAGVVPAALVSEFHRCVARPSPFARVDFVPYLLALVREECPWWDGAQGIQSCSPAQAVCSRLPVWERLIEHLADAGHLRHRPDLRTHNPHGVWVVVHHKHQPYLTADGNPAHGCECCDGDDICTCPNKRGRALCRTCGGRWPDCEAK